MKLYMHPLSQNARKARVVARLLELPLEEQSVDLMRGDGERTEYLALNPNGMVPVLRDADFVLWESNAICQYLASKAPSTLWPDDTRLRADISRWQCWELAHWGPALFHYFKENMIKQFMGGGAPDAAELRKGEEQFNRFGGVLNGHLSANRYLVGETFTLADLSVASHLMHAGMGKVPVQIFPHIQRWFDEISRLPAWRATEPGLS